MPKGKGKGRGIKRAAAVAATACIANHTALDARISSLPQYFLRHWPPRSVSFEASQRTYQESLVGWGRTRFQIVGGQLYYPNLKYYTFGCVLRRTPILAWALLETLKRHPSLPDVDIPVNCRDKPGSSRRGKGFKPPPLAFSYTTGREFSDVPLPDYTFWGLPYADLPPWPEWLHFAASPENAWERKLDKMVWVGSPTNPLRQAFQRCAPQFFGERLIHRMPQKDPMHELAWRCKPTVDGKPCGVKPPDWTPLQEQCKYKYILHLPGISDWLEHFKHQLACGSVNIFLGPRPPKQWAMRRQRLQQLSPPSTFEHFDFGGPLLTESEHFVHVPIGGANGGGGGGGVCRQLQSVLQRLEAEPDRAKCIAAEGQRLSRSLNMEVVYDYMAGILREASLRQQEDVAKRVIQAESSRKVTRQNYFSFVPPAKRPWMQHIFVPWHKQLFNETPLVPPHGPETASGLFH